MGWYDNLYNAFVLETDYIKIIITLNLEVM